MLRSTTRVGNLCYFMHVVMQPKNDENQRRGDSIRVSKYCSTYIPAAHPGIEPVIGLSGLDNLPR